MKKIKEWLKCLRLKRKNYLANETDREAANRINLREVTNIASGEHGWAITLDGIIVYYMEDSVLDEKKLIEQLKAIRFYYTNLCGPDAELDLM